MCQLALIVEGMPVPEVVARTSSSRPSRGALQVDVWSAGVVAYEVLTGRAPFSASSAAKILEVRRSSGRAGGRVVVQRLPVG